MAKLGRLVSQATTLVKRLECPGDSDTGQVESEFAKDKLTSLAKLVDSTMVRD